MTWPSEPEIGGGDAHHLPPYAHRLVATALIIDAHHEIGNLFQDQRSRH